MTTQTLFGKEAQELGQKIWKRSKDIGLGTKVFSAKQLSNLSWEENALLKTGWVAFAYCDFGIQMRSGGEMWIFRKDVA